MSQTSLSSTLLSAIDWQKVQGLIPAIVQDKRSRQVLMLGFMNKEALEKTIETGLVTFWSRTKARLWTKGEGSKNYLLLENIALDCDKDSLLIQATPQGNTCHLGKISCFDDALEDGTHKAPAINIDFLQKLETLISNRQHTPSETSYTCSLFAKGTKRIAQKVGEEGLEVALAAMANDKEEVLYESADLLYHLLVLLKDQNCSLAEVIEELAKR